MNQCFVCKKELSGDEKTYNKRTNLPVCKQCKNTDAEKKAEQEAMDSLGDGFICGCI